MTDGEIVESRGRNAPAPLGSLPDEIQGTGGITRSLGDLTVRIQPVNSDTGRRVATFVFRAGESGPLAEVRGLMSKRQAQDAGISESTRGRFNDLVRGVQRSGKIPASWSGDGGDLGAFAEEIDGLSAQELADLFVG